MIDKIYRAIPIFSQCVHEYTEQTKSGKFLKTMLIISSLGQGAI